jgi:hypothetical protein
MDAKSKGIAEGHLIKLMEEDKGGQGQVSNAVHAVWRCLPTRQLANYSIQDPKMRWKFKFSESMNRKLPCRFWFSRDPITESERAICHKSELSWDSLTMIDVFDDTTNSLYSKPAKINVQHPYQSLVAGHITSGS